MYFQLFNQVSKSIDILQKNSRKENKPSWLILLPHCLSLLKRKKVNFITYSLGILLREANTFAGASPPYT